MARPFTDSMAVTGTSPSITIMPDGGGVARNIGLVGGSVTGVSGGGAYYNFGMLAGKNAGTIANAYATGTVSANGNPFDAMGDLVGNNSGTVSSSYASGTVNGGNGNQVGGLVGVNNGGRVSSS